MAEHIPDGSIIITPKEFYDGVRSDIGGINLNVSALWEELGPLPSRVNKLEATVEDLKKRMDGVDRKIVWFAGFAAGAGGTVGTIVSKAFGV